ncbi:MAG TPA: hypothetical protein PKE55_02360 [Kiritimatiellia bacterium]|nr:hypothetical protein [Kiritimatiellia bacterium]
MPAPRYPSFSTTCSTPRCGNSILRYAEAEGALLGQLHHFHTEIYGNRDFVDHLRSRGKFLDHEENQVLVSFHAHIFKLMAAMSSFHLLALYEFIAIT